MESPVTSRTFQFVARLVAMALLVLIALAIQGQASSQAAGVAPALDAGGVAEDAAEVTPWQPGGNGSAAGPGARERVAGWVI